MKPLKNKIEDAYAFEEGKTYMVSVDTVDKEEIENLIVELYRSNPKIRWIVVPMGMVKPIPNPEAQKLMDETLKNIIDEIDNYPVEHILESETEANAKDVLNDIGQIIKKHGGKE